MKRLRKPLIRGLLSLLICALINGIILGIFTVVHKLPNHNYLWASYVGFISILIYGWWLYYLPALLAFFVSIRFIHSVKFIYYMSLGATWGGLWSAFFLLLQPRLPRLVWYSMPTPNEWFTIPTYVLVGAIYGFVYRKWLMEKSSLKTL
ncbi:hypothetical protein [Spirosoma endophyticum]|uniref:Uncharacterized protein n=1 Tax=Spirosoma endophyticum TaxID=662367 RepID=A0A1I1VB39_9BACT|nr:hypothetical protein [Spirosoma endophyticum]SFD80187.1 hypothetical protein SAMN05216167_107112 [Spirosoma endophyticum]